MPLSAPKGKRKNPTLCNFCGWVWWKHRASPGVLWGNWKCPSKK